MLEATCFGQVWSGAHVYDLDITKGIVGPGREGGGMALVVLEDEGFSIFEPKMVHTVCIDVRRVVGYRDLIKRPVRPWIRRYVYTEYVMRA